MTGRKKDPLRKLSEEEREWLERISRSQSEPASHVIRAKEILAVADGCSYTQAAERVGRKCGDPVSHLVEQFNREGLAAVQPKHGGGPKPKYTAAERERVLQEADCRARWHEHLVVDHLTASAAESNGWLAGDQYGTHLGDLAGSGLPLAEVAHLV